MSSKESSPEAIAFDPMFIDTYLAIREDIVEGRRVATVLTFGDDPDEVHSTIRANRRENPKSLYRFYKPLEGKNRESWTIGGNE